MPMTKEELKNAFREAASYEFRDVPRDDSLIQYEFSPEFEKKIGKLINKEKSFFWHFVNTAGKRAAVIAVVTAALFTAAFSVDAIREPVVRFIVKIYETFTEHRFEGGTADTILKEYTMTVIPDGFSQTRYTKSDTSVTTVYENSSGNKIYFVQSVTDGSLFSVDNEKTETVVYEVSGREVHYYEQGDIIIATWIEDSYCMQISFRGTFSKDTVLALIQTIE